MRLVVESDRTWRQAAKRYGKARAIHAGLMQELQGHLGASITEQIKRNAAFIKSVPDDIARAMTEHIMSRSFEGIRASDIAKELQEKYKHISTVKANLIARTETSKTNTALTKTRSEMMGIPWYRWRTSEDARVRDSHKKMDKVLIAWDDPPSPEALDHEKDVGHYHAGSIWNCRCYCEPLVTMSFIEWPAKVYYRGSIIRMTRAQFERILNPGLAVAMGG